MTSKSRILNTALFSENLGDTIILDAIIQEFPQFSQLQSTPTHRFMSVSQALNCLKCDFLFLTGTNALSSNPLIPRPWRFGPLEWLATWKRVIPIGVGWRDYENSPTWLQRLIYKNLFFEQIPVSVRDRHSERILKKIGVKAIYTGCPTMWGISKDLPGWTAEREVVTTVTHYRPDIERDTKMLESLSELFERVLIWPQSHRDVEYISRLPKRSNVNLVPGDLESFNDVLTDRVFFGTRLHAGIRASQLQRPAVVVGVDNRALEIGRDTNFRVIKRSDTGLTPTAIENILRQPATIDMPVSNIEMFKKLVANLDW